MNMVKKRTKTENIQPNLDIPIRKKQKKLEENSSPEQGGNDLYNMLFTELQRKMDKKINSFQKHKGMEQKLTEMLGQISQLEEQQRQYHENQIKQCDKLKSIVSQSLDLIDTIPKTNFIKKNETSEQKETTQYEQLKQFGSSTKSDVPSIIKDNEPTETENNQEVAQKQTSNSKQRDSSSDTEQNDSRVIDRNDIRVVRDSKFQKLLERKQQQGLSQKSHKNAHRNSKKIDNTVTIPNPGGLEQSQIQYECQMSQDEIMVLLLQRSLQKKSNMFFKNFTDEQLKYIISKEVLDSQVGIEQKSEIIKRIRQNELFENFQGKFEGYTLIRIYDKFKVKCNIPGQFENFEIKNENQ